MMALFLQPDVWQLTEKTLFVKFLLENHRAIIAQSYGGGETGRIVPKKKKARTAAGETADEFVAYARFLNESTHGYSPLGFRAENEKNKALAPRFINGRFVSASPEHSLIRVGGDGEKCGAGGSGVGTYFRHLQFAFMSTPAGIN